MLNKMLIDDLNDYKWWIRAENDKGGQNWKFWHEPSLENWSFGGYFTSELLREGLAQNYRPGDWVHDNKNFRLKGALRLNYRGLYDPCLCYPIRGSLHSTSALDWDHIALGPSNSYSIMNRSGVLLRILGFLDVWGGRVILSRNWVFCGDNRLMVPKSLIARALGALFSLAWRIELVCEPMVAQISQFSSYFGSVCSNSSFDVLIAPFPLKLMLQSCRFQVLMDLGVQLLWRRSSRFYSHLKLG